MHLYKIIFSILLNFLTGNRKSAYYIPDLIDDVFRVCKDFPLWTSVMQSIFKSPSKIASSAVVECSFNELKNQILRFDIKPMAVDKFVISHLKNIESNAKLFHSAQQRNISSQQYVKNSHDVDKSKLSDRSDYSSSDTDDLLKSNDESEENVETDNSFNNYENWKGKGNDDLIIPHKNKKPRLTKYMDPVPEIDRILLNRKTRSSKNNLLKNGNIQTPLTISKKRFLLQNTCPFDSITVLIAIAYNENEKYKNYLNNSTNDLLKFCKKLATEPVSRNTYISRLSLLRKIFQEDTGITDISLIDARCNVNFIATSFLKESPSAEEHRQCTNKKCTNSKNISSPTIILHTKQHDLTLLEDSLKLYVVGKSTNCMDTKCKGILEVSRTLQDHIFIETDVFTETKNYILTDIPLHLNINNERYEINY